METNKELLWSIFYFQDENFSTKFYNFCVGLFEIPDASVTQ